MAKMRYEELLPHELETILRTRPIAYVPLGTLEYHGAHLAVGNDGLKAQAILERSCAHTGGVLLPTLYWGIGGGHKDYPASLIVRDELLAPLLDDVLGGLYRVGFRIVVLLTGHYSREQEDQVRAAGVRFRQVHRDARIWALPEYEAFPGQYRGDHAAKWETSILLYLRPELVELSLLAGAEGPEAPERVPSEAGPQAPGPLHGIMGLNPARYASRELGRETVDTIVDQLTAWVQRSLDELS